MVRSHARRSGISSVDDLESESVSTEKEEISEGVVRAYLDSDGVATYRDYIISDYGGLLGATQQAHDDGAYAVHLPKNGYYTESAGLTITKGGFTMAGPGVDGVFVNWEGSGPAITVDAPKVTVEGFAIRSANSGQTAIDLVTASNLVTVRGINFSSGWAKAIDCSAGSTFRSTVERCSVNLQSDATDTYGIDFSGNTGHGNEIRECFISGIANWAIGIRGTETSVRRCTFTGNGTDPSGGVRVTGGSLWSVKKCNFEQLTDDTGTEVGVAVSVMSPWFRGTIEDNLVQFCEHALALEGPADSDGDRIDVGKVTTASIPNGDVCDLNNIATGYVKLDPYFSSAIANDANGRAWGFQPDGTKV